MAYPSRGARQRLHGGKTARGESRTMSIEGIEIDEKGGLLCLDVGQLIDGVPGTKYKGWKDRVGGLDAELMRLRHHTGVANERRAVQRRLNAANRILRELERWLVSDHPTISVNMFRAMAQKVRADTYWFSSDITDEEREDRTHETWPTVTRRVEALQHAA